MLAVSGILSSAASTVDKLPLVDARLLENLLIQYGSQIPTASFIASSIDDISAQLTAYTQRVTDVQLQLSADKRRMDENRTLSILTDTIDRIQSVPFTLATCLCVLLTVWLIVANVSFMPKLTSVLCPTLSKDPTAAIRNVRQCKLALLLVTCTCVPVMGVFTVMCLLAASGVDRILCVPVFHDYNYTLFSLSTHFNLSNSPFPNSVQQLNLQRFLTECRSGHALLQSLQMQPSEQDPLMAGLAEAQQQTGHMEQVFVQSSYILHR